MLSRAKSRYVRVSPYKLRPIANVIRGLAVDKAVSWLKIHSIKRMRPITKTLMSAYANIKGSGVEDSDIPMNALFIKEIRVDQGPVITYFKPGAMGKACLQQKRMSHLEIVLDRKPGVRFDVKKNIKKSVVNSKQDSIEKNK